MEDNGSDPLSSGPPVVIEALPAQRVPEKVPYSEERMTEVLSHYVRGRSLQEIAEEPGMPSYDTFLEWAQNNEAFRVRMKSGREARALMHEERAIRLAEQAIDHCPGDVSAHRLGFDAHKWAAEVNDPAKYGKKTTLSGDVNAPIHFVISTGFPEPNNYQRPPKLGKDGLIIREEVAKELDGKDD